MLAKGPTPSVDPAIWRFTIHDGSQLLAQWTWAQFETLPQTVWRGDIHCVTKWSKLDTTWSGVTIDDLFQSAGVTPPSAAKWIKGLRFTARDEAGFWEQRGYHMYGDPWREQRYTNDP